MESNKATSLLSASLTNFSLSLWVKSQARFNTTVYEFPNLTVRKKEEVPWVLFIWLLG